MNLNSVQIYFPKYDHFRSNGNNVTVVDNVPADMLHLVHTYWYQFAPMNSLWFGILGLFLILLIIIAFCGNVMVIYIFTTTKSLRTPSNLFVVNLAMSDFMMMMTMAPPMIFNCYYETWVLGPLMCDLYGISGSLFGCVSIWSMTMIAFDRYNVIVNGMSRKPLTTTGAIIIIIMIWIVCIIWTLFPLFGWNRYVPEGNMTSCGTDYFTTTWLSRSYILVYSGFVYFTPLCLIIYSYFHILKTVSKHEKNMRQQAKKMNVSSLRTCEDKNKSVEIKLAKIALCTIALWFFAWTPYLIINYCGIFNLLTLTPSGTIWGSVCAKSNCVINPIIYGISHPKYQLALYKKIPCLDCRKTNNLNDDSNSQVTAEENK